MAQDSDYHTIAAAIAYLDSNWRAQPSLADVAAAVGLSETHLQRLFTRWAGISPKRFLQYRTAEAAKRMLRTGPSVLDATFEAGLSGSGRLHDLIVSAEAVTPGEYKRFGEGVVIHWGVHPSPFGDALIAQTARGICHLSFLDPVSRGEALARLRQEWPAAQLEESTRATRAAAAQLFETTQRAEPLALHLRGTNFQLKVWRALLEIPEGAVTNYGQLARAVGSPTSARAVGGAVGSNPIGWIIPCHRVLRADGALGGYAWGTERKAAMLMREEVRGQRSEVSGVVPDL